MGQKAAIRFVGFRGQALALGGAILIACSAVPTSAQEPVSGGNILITNGTKIPLACRLRNDATVWTDHQKIAPDYALNWPAVSGVRSYLECSPPVSTAVYEILAGKHYILVQDKQRPGVELRAVAALKK